MILEPYIVIYIYIIIDIRTNIKIYIYIQTYIQNFQLIVLYIYIYTLFKTNFSYFSFGNGPKVATLVRNVSDPRLHPEWSLGHELTTGI